MINYFELYELPISFRPDAVKVKAKFYELSRRFHPDRFTLASDHERAEALRMAALNNDAYKTLNNEDRTMAYVLKLHEMLEDDEKYNLPAEFLMEMMDLNESITEYEMDADSISLRAAAESNIQEQMVNWDNNVTPLLIQYDSGANEDPNLLAKIKDFYFRKKYLLRIQERVSTFASR